MDKAQKGKLGVQMRFYAALAFGLAMFGQVLAGVVLLGFVLYVERDEWTSRQCMEALFLQLLGLVAGLLRQVAAGVLGGYSMPAVSVGNVADYLDYLTGGYYEPSFWMVIAFVLGVVCIVLELLVFIWAIAGLLRVVKGGEARIPLATDWAWAAYNKAAPIPGVTQQKPEKDMDDGFKPEE